MAELLTGAALAAQMESRKKFEQQMLASGAKVQNTDGIVVRPRTPAPSAGGGTAEQAAVATAKGRSVPLERPKALPTIIDLGVDESEHTIVIMVRGERREIHPQISTGGLRRSDWYQQQSQRVQAELATCEDDALAEQLQARLGELQHKQARLLVPDLPQGVLDALSPGMFRKFMEALGEVTAHAMGETADPLGYARAVYDRVGQPNGEGNAGLLAWLEERLPHIEPDEDDDPNAVAALT